MQLRALLLPFAAILKYEQTASVWLIFQGALLLAETHIIPRTFPRIISQIFPVTEGAGKPVCIPNYNFAVFGNYLNMCRIIAYLLLNSVA